MAESQQMAADGTSCENTFYSGLKNLRALTIAVFFVGIVSFNLLYPSPTGPPDNGDFNRIFASFSSGPVGHDFWPSLENQDAFQKRFHNFYHRFWRHDEGKKGDVHFSSSRLFFWPGRLLSLTSGIFDLAWNGLLLTLLAGCVLYFSLKNVDGTLAVFSLGVLAFIFADANIAGYLNSFYEESGAFLSFFFLVCVLHVFWIRRNLPSLVIIFVLSLILAGTKMAYTLSVLPAILPILAGVILFTPKSFYLRRCAISVVVLLLLASPLPIKFLALTSSWYETQACYHFIFSGVTPVLSPNEGKAFLHEIGLDPSLISLRGKNAYEPDSQSRTEPLRSALTTRLHLKAAARLIFHHPAAFLEMTRFSFSKAGFYPRLLYPSLSAPPEITFRFRWCLWSRLHDRFLNGIPYYGTVLFLILILGTLVWKQKDSGWSLFYLLAAIGLFPASLLQVIISVIGGGPLDIVKHQYFANLLLDVAFVFALCGLIVTVLSIWKKGANRLERYLDKNCFWSDSTRNTVGNKSAIIGISLKLDHSMQK
jgi:hypothetical protein